jgi:hypothetical protein
MIDYKRIIDGHKCCKCPNGGRGAWPTRCYDDPKFCCKESNKNIKKKTNKKNSKKSKKLSTRKNKSFFNFLF